MMDSETKDPIKDEKPPKIGFHDRKIAQLEARRRLPPPQPDAPRPRGVPPPSKHLGDEDRKFNEALDRMIQLWKLQKDKVKGRDGQLQEHFKKGKIRGKAKGDFER